MNNISDAAFFTLAWRENKSGFRRKKGQFKDSGKRAVVTVTSIDQCRIWYGKAESGTAK